MFLVLKDAQGRIILQVGKQIPVFMQIKSNEFSKKLSDYWPDILELILLNSIKIKVNRITRISGANIEI